MIKHQHKYHKHHKQSISKKIIRPSDFVKSSSLEYDYGAVLFNSEALLIAILYIISWLLLQV